MSQKKVGFIGLGIMGQPMCLNLLKAGYEVTAYNRTISKIEKVVAAGAIKALSPREVAEKSDIIICTNELLTNEVKRKYGKKEVYTIPDRVDLDNFSLIKRHHDVKEPIYVWHGGAKTYIRLSATLLPYIIERNYFLRIVGSQTASKKTGCYLDYEGISDVREWRRNTYLTDMVDADIGLDPELPAPTDETESWGYEILKYRSQIKTLELWALGLPVVKTIEDIERFRDYKTREEESSRRLKEIKEKWDIRISAKELMTILGST